MESMGSPTNVRSVKNGQGPNVCVLDDGRRLAYDEHGELTGHPVLVFHGVPGSRLQLHPDASLVSDLGVRLVTVDRPGYGQSDPQPRRSLCDWPADVEQLADHLGLASFSVVGVSGGGVFALACAQKIPERITKLALVSSPAPLQVPGIRKSLIRSQRMQLGLAARAPWAVRFLFGLQARSIRKLTEQAVRAKLADELLPSERAHLEVPGFVAMLLADAKEGIRNGPDAIALELALISRPWGFDLQDIRVPIRLWQGEEDTNVSLEMGHYLARALPLCEATFFPGEGHLVGFAHWKEIIQWVSATSR